MGHVHVQILRPEIKETPANAAANVVVQIARWLVLFSSRVRANFACGNG